jgi:hypothetical protein
MTTTEKAKLQTIANKVLALQSSKSVNADEYAVLNTVLHKLVELGAEI